MTSAQALAITVLLGFAEAECARGRPDVAGDAEGQS